MKHDLFDKIVQDKALAHESQVPADAWDNIQKNKRKRRYGFFWWMLPLLLAGVTVFGVYQYNHNGHKADKENSVVVEERLEAGRTSVEKPNGKDNVSVTGENVPEPVVKSNDGETTSIAVLPNSNSTNEVAYSKEVSKTEHTAHTRNDEKVNPVNNKNYTSTIKSKNKPGGNDALNIAAGKNNIVKNKNRLPARKQIVNGKENNGSDVIINEYQAKKRTSKTKGKTNTAITAATAEEDGKVIADKPVLVKEDKKNDQPAEKVTAVISAQAGKKDGKNETPPVTVVTKKDDKKEKKTRNLFIDISVSPFMPLQSRQKLLMIERTTIGTGYKTVFKADNIYNELDPSLAFTISLRKEFNKKWGASVGVQYTKIKETIKLTGKETNTQYNYIKRLDPSGSSLIDDTVHIITEGIRNIDAVNSYDFLTIPLGVQYKLYQNKKWVVAINGGVNINIRSYYRNSIEGDVKHTYASGSNSTAKTNSKVTADIYAGLRLTRIINNKTQVFAEPFLQLNFMKYNMPAMINNKNIHRAGINIGLSYGF